uniref:Uncharacterized protein n=1 Tax=Oreochromis aureus TaxID=47969 RepID=A0AAZ1XL66_OREAU
MPLFSHLGAPYRLESLETPLTTRKKAVMWTGEHGFFDHAKPAKGESQVFYPTPPKTVLPNPKLRNWDLTLSERTSNILKNLEKTLWVTSYQMQYTGSGPANPLMTDDFKEKMTNFAGLNSHTKKGRILCLFLLKQGKDVEKDWGAMSGGAAAVPLLLNSKIHLQL